MPASGEGAALSLALLSTIMAAATAHSGGLNAAREVRCCLFCAACCTGWLELLAAAACWAQVEQFLPLTGVWSCMPLSSRLLLPGRPVLY